MKLRIVLLGVLILGLGLVFGAGALAQGQKVTENFEAGFSRLPWGAEWVISSSERHSGTYAAQAGKTVDDSYSRLSVRMEVSVTGEISFWYKVSSKSNRDFLHFYIDDQEMGKWSGETGWQKASYQVAVGTHSFSWRYIKDGSGSGGQDSAWIDDISFPTAQIEKPSCTVTVSPGSSIQSAIDRAAPGDVICLTEGVWKENLLIEKSLTLIGAGSDKTIIKGKKAQPVIEIGEGLPEWAGVFIRNLKITESKTDENGLTISNDENAEVRIENCIISENGRNGIEVKGSSYVFVHKSFITNNKYVGILIGGDSWCSVDGTVVCSNNESGVLVGKNKNGRATIEFNNISGNGKGGISVFFPANFAILGNNISNNKKVGIAIMGTEQNAYGPGGIEISGNEISNNAGGVYIAFAFIDAVAHNEIHHNDQCGIFMGEGGALCWENKVYANGENYCERAKLYCR